MIDFYAIMYDDSKDCAKNKTQINRSLREKVSKFSAIKTEIMNADSISIHAHVNPDADAFGSALATKKFIQSLPGKENTRIDIFIDVDEIPELYVPMVNGAIINPVPKTQYDLAIGLDSPTTARYGRFEEVYKSAKRKINLDHHQSNEHFGDLNVVWVRSSSTCELLYLLFKYMNEDLITKDIGTLLYCGIITDTSCLSEGIITSNTYNTIKDLINKDINDQALREYFFKNISKSKAIIEGKATKATKFIENDRIALMLIKNSDLVNAGATYEDTYGIIDRVSSIKSVELTVLVVEKDDGSFHISLRSRGNVDVLSIAEKMNGGGNNINMAAFQYTGELADLKSFILEETKAELKKHPLEEQIEKDPFDFDEDK